MFMDSFQTVLVVLESLHNQSPELESSALEDLKVQLRLLQTFYMCGRRWGGNGVHSKSTLLSIEQIVHKYAHGFQSVGERWNRLHQRASRFLVCIQQSFSQDMEELYLIFSQGSSQTSISSGEEVQLVSIMDSLLHNLQDRLQYRISGRASTVPIEGLEENVRFLKNFFLFANFQGLEHWQMKDLLSQVEGFLLGAARLTFMSWYYSYHKTAENVYQLIEKIRPVKSRINDIYVGVLQASKLSMSSHQVAPGSRSLVFLDFVDSYIVLLEELLVMGTSYMNIFNHQMKKLYGDLKFLRTIMKEHQDKFDELYENMHNLIGHAICEAGIVICHLFKEENVVDLIRTLEAFFSDLDGKFKLVKAEVEQRIEDPKTMASDIHPSNMSLIDSVLEKLNKSVTTLEPETKKKLQSVYADLKFLRSFLEDVVLLCDQNEKLKSLQNRIVGVANETDSFLDPLMAGEVLESFVVRLNTVSKEITLITADTSKTYSNMLSAGEFMVGFEDESQKIINGLERGTKLLDIVSIVGMAGLGKTTLAKMVYRHPNITHRFSARSWCRVSQSYNKKSLLLQILQGLYNKNDEKLCEKDENDLAEELYHQLKGKRYLIILDDVWDITVWSSLLNSFPTDLKESRILLTTRDHSVALKIKPDRKPHNLRWLDEGESWTLMQKKIRYEEGCIAELPRVGPEIAKLCKGLPLMILVVAGILSNSQPDTWDEVAESLRKGILSLTEQEQCKKSLNLSYSYLPSHLKLCFLYLGAFQEYFKIPVRKLLWLWISDGLVEKSENECLENVAEGYLKELIQRNVVMVGEEGSGGSIKSCILHDLLRDFCKLKGDKENFLHCLHRNDLDEERGKKNDLGGEKGKQSDLGVGKGKKNDLGREKGKKTALATSIKPSILYRPLHVDSSRAMALVESRQLSPPFRSLFVVADRETRWYNHKGHWYHILHKICQPQLLRVLELRRVTVGPFFPRVIELHLHLKYLALAFAVEGDVLTIPSSIGGLSNLETFIVEGSRLHVSLPDTMWNLENLRHVWISGIACWELPKENPEDGPKCLWNLETLSTVAFPNGHTMEKVMRKLPRIRKFKCNLIRAGGSMWSRKCLALECMSEMESLAIFQIHKKFHDFHFQLPQKLKKLVLSGLCLPWSEVSAIDELPELEVLKLLNNAFTGEIWDVGEGKFSKLKFLKLADLDLSKWRDSGDNFPCLEKLVLERCLHLDEIPSCLISIGALAMIEVFECESATCLVNKLQEDAPDEYLKVLIHPPRQKHI